MVVEFGPFQGVVPRVDPYLLQVTQGEVATNCYFSSGSLQALRSAELADKPLSGGTGDIEAVYRHDTLSASYWVSFRAPADIVPSPVSRDTYRRLYFSSVLYASPRLVAETLLHEGATNPATTYALGVPAPATAEITVSSAVGGDSSGGVTTQESRYYAVTWVTQYGEESAPSGLVGVRNLDNVITGPVVVYPGGTVTVTVPDKPLLAAVEMVIAKANIYRTNTGSSGSALQYVGTIELGVNTVNTTFVDTVPSSSLAEVIQTSTWTQPQPGLTGLVVMACGALAGFVGRQICFSEPYYPHAWPVAYERPLEDDIVGLGVFGRSLLVLTTRNPFVFTGDHPGNMERQRIDDGLACVSKRSIVDIGVGILYATPEGIMFVGSSGARLVSSALFTRREWSSINPETIHAYNYGGRYVGFYDTGILNDQGELLRGGFILDLDGNWSWLTTYATAGWYDSKSGQLYLVVNDVVGAAQMFLFDVGASQACYWESRPLATNRAMNFGAARIRAEGWPVTLTLYATDTAGTEQVMFSRSVMDEKPFRLPAGYRSDKYRMGLATAGKVHKCWLAESLAELVRS